MISSRTLFVIDVWLVKVLTGQWATVTMMQVLCQLTSVVNYGGRITDDKDMRTSDIIIADFFNPKILTENYAFSKSGTYFSLDPGR